MKAYILLAEGFEITEVVATADVLLRGGADVELVSVANSILMRSSHNFMLGTDKVYAIGEEDKMIDALSDGDVVILPGGMPGTKNLAANKCVLSILENYSKADKYLAAICAAPSILGMNGYLKGKKAVCYPGFEDQLIGAEYVNERAVVDGKIITARAMGCAVDFGLAILRAVEGEEAAAKAESGLYR